MRLTVAVAMDDDGCVETGVLVVCWGELSGFSTLDRLKDCM
jgi:hypothetical protein